MLLVQAWDVEEQGGLLRADGSGKRRTPGGVFLWLVKQQSTPEQRARVWPLRAEDAPAAKGTAAGASRGRGRGRGGKGGGRTGGREAPAAGGGGPAAQMDDASGM